MNGTVNSIWPGDVRNSLWNYDRTIAGPSGNQLLPLSDYPLNGEFLLYFLIGLVVVWLYAWNRFNRRSYDPSPFDYRVLRELQPAQMRDTLMMQRAFILYAMVLSLIYASFTFFGGIIFKLLKPIASVGPGIDTATLQSPQWPLMLAFGLAGLTQLIGPLDHLEKTLRGHIHRSLGIPIRIKEYTRQLIATQIQELKLEAAGKDADDKQKVYRTGQIEEQVKALSDSHVSCIQPWAREEIAQTYGVEDILAKLILLWRMIDCLYSPTWPRESVRDEMRPLLARQLYEGRTAALYLSELLSSPPVNDAKAKNPPPGQGTPHRTRQEQQLITAIESMERHLYEVAAILAVYAQRDRSYDKVHGESLKNAITSVFKEENHGPSLRQLVCCAAVLFVIYCVGITMLNHGMMTDMPVNAWSTAISALYETVRTLCVFVFPVLFAIYMTAPDPEQGTRVFSATGQVVTASLWAGAASLVLMIMAAMIYSWLVARTTADFNTLLMGRPGISGGGRPVLVWFLTFVPISALIAAMVALARHPASNRRHVLAMGVVGVLAALLAVLHFVVIENQLSRCFGGQDTSSEQVDVCWMVVADILAMKFTDMTAALVAVLFLAQSRQSGRTSIRMTDQPGAPVPRLAGTALAFCLMTGPATPLLAQADTANADSKGPRPIVLGFRDDAAPFSFLNTRGGNTRHQGYIADLCHEIFAGSPDYIVTTRSVTVQDRFKHFRPERDAQGDFIDVLCDPVTIRYDDPERWTNSIFSPIIFATGVTYLRRHGDSANQNVELGYVTGTTAKAVADDICQDAQTRGTHVCQVPQFTAPALDPVAPFVESYRKPPSGIDKNDDTAFSWNKAITTFWQKLTAPQKRDGKLKIVHRSFDSHAKAAEWFCKELGDVQRFYLGDREVIMAHAAQQETRFPACKDPKPGPLFTYEPYALLVTKSDPDLVQFVQRRIFHIFSDTSKARSLFAASFPDRQMTTSLAHLFLLNGVDEERTMEHPDPAVTLSLSPAGPDQSSDR